MKRLMTSTCLAAAFAVGLAAQSTTSGTSGQDPQGQGRGGPRPVTATGCLRAGDTAGTYMLTDVQIQGGGRRSGDTTGTTAGGTTAGTTAGTTGGGTTAGGAQARGNMPTTLNLSPAADVDLKPHVGHKIEITGTMAGGRPQGSGGTTTAGGTTTSGTTGGGTTTGTSTGTSAAGAGTQGANRAMRNVTVTSIRMISESCS